MSGKEFRALSQLEKSIIMSLVSVVDDNENLLKQIESARVKEIDDYGSLKFDGFEAHPYMMVSGPLVTGQQEDVDTIENSGPYINFILLLKDGFMSELDIYKDDGSKAVAMYDPVKFSLCWGLPPR